jgi:5-methylcytosine-specific restriction protein A
MTRGVRVCAQPGCGNFQPCPTPGHTPTPWEGSTRKARLPPDWQRRRRRILRRDFTCRHPGCDSLSDEVDHIDGTDNHNDSNLQGLCRYHHQQKTVREARQARERNQT